MSELSSPLSSLLLSSSESDNKVEVMDNHEGVEVGPPRISSPVESLQDRVESLESLLALPPAFRDKWLSPIASLSPDEYLARLQAGNKRPVGRPLPNGRWDIPYDARYHEKLAWKRNSDLEAPVISNETFDLVKMDGVLSAKSKVLVKSLVATKHIHDTLVSVVEVVS